MKNHSSGRHFWLFSTVTAVDSSLINSDTHFRPNELVNRYQMAISFLTNKSTPPPPLIAPKKTTFPVQRGARRTVSDERHFLKDCKSSGSRPKDRGEKKKVGNRGKKSSHVYMG